MAYERENGRFFSLIRYAGATLQAFGEDDGLEKVTLRVAFQFQLFDGQPPDNLTFRYGLVTTGLKYWTKAANFVPDEAHSLGTASLSFKGIAAKFYRRAYLFAMSYTTPDGVEEWFPHVQLTFEQVAIQLLASPDSTEDEKKIARNVITTVNSQTEENA